MQAEKDHVVRFHYRVFDTAADGDALEDSRSTGQALAVILGRSGLIQGLEAALLGRSAGEAFSVTLPADEAYGPYRPELVQRAPKKHLRNAAALKPGMRTTVQTRQGPRWVTVLKTGLSVVDLDMNHPMAGKDLRFEVEMVDVRAATAEELEHGHAHGPGGHQH